MAYRSIFPENTSFTEQSYIINYLERASKKSRYPEFPIIPIEFIYDIFQLKINYKHNSFSLKSNRFVHLSWSKWSISLLRG